MQFLSPIPQIEISLAPPQVPAFEPYSPFNQLAFPSDSQEDDGFRPVHLTPPPTVTNFKRPRSPLRQVSDSLGKGLEGDRFQALLKATKDRNSNAALGIRKTDLRKEIAVKVHKNKQAERRALFLSKVHAPPSPTATMTPKTPPESPAIFHYSLPSPGLVSPLALFESLNGNRDAAQDGWVEQVDFRLSAERARTMNTKSKPSVLPSLDQISARMMSRTARQSDYDPDSMTPVYTARPRPSFGVGRLKMPLRTAPVPIVSTQPQHALPPRSPLLNPSNDLSVTTLVVPRSNSSSPTKLTETNLNALNSRGQRASNMLTALRKRTLSQEKISTPTMEANSEFKTRRRSAPADLMPRRARVGFEHPVLALPGAF